MSTQLYRFKVLTSRSKPQSSLTTAVFTQEQKNNANRSASTTSAWTKFYTFCCKDKGKVHLKHGYELLLAYESREN